MDTLACHCGWVVRKTHFLTDIILEWFHKESFIYDVYHLEVRSGCLKFYDTQNKINFYLIKTL